LVIFRRSAEGNMKSLLKTKVFLRHRESGQYYAGSNGWTGSSSVAHDFETVESAAQLARNRGLAGIEVVVRDDDDPDCDLVLPFTQQW
jgi:hypothetical protein